MTKINYNNICDLERFEKFRIMMNNFASIQKLNKLFNFIIFETENMIPTLGASVFIFPENFDLMRKIKLDERLIIQK